MKKLITGTFALFLTISTFAQNGKVISAYNYLEDYTHPEGDTKGRGDIHNLEQAVTNIEAAIADPSTANSSKAWWYRAKIYETISTCRDSNLVSKYSTASLEVVKSIRKLEEINDPKFKDWSDVYNYLIIAGPNTFNDGVTAYNKKDFHKASLFFSAVSDIQDLLAAKGQKPDTGLANKALGNAALMAENDNDNAGALAIYKKILAVSPNSKLYVSIVSLLKKTKDIESAKKYTDEGLAKYPTESELLIDKINFFWTDEKYNDVIPFIIKAISLDPKNAQLQAFLGMAYAQIKDTMNARISYEKALAIDPNSLEANRGIGGMLYNQSNIIQQQMNDLGTSKEDMKKNEELKLKRNALFMQAKPYLENVLKKDPNDEEIKRTLSVIDIRTKN